MRSGRAARSPITDRRTDSSTCRTTPMSQVEGHRISVHQLVQALVRDNLGRRGHRGAAALRRCGEGLYNDGERG